MESWKDHNPQSKIYIWDWEYVLEQGKGLGQGHTASRWQK